MMSFRLASSFRVSCLLAALWTSSVHAQKPQSGLVTFHNHEKLPVQIKSLDESLQINSAFFAGNLKLQPSQIRSLDFSSQIAPSTSAEKSPEFSLRLKNGKDRLFGKIISLDDAQTILENNTLGRISIPTAKILDITRRPPSERTTTYHSLNWQPGENFSFNEFIELPKRSPHALEIPQKILPNNHFSIAFRSVPTTEFLIKLDLPENEAFVSADITIAVSHETALVKVDEDIEFCDFSSLNGTSHLTLAWDGRELLLLNDLLQTLISIPMEDNNPVPITISNKGSALQILEMSLSAEPLKPASEQITNQQNLIRSAQKWEPVETFQIQNGELTSPSVQIPLAKLERIWLGKSPAPAAAPEPKPEVEQPTSPNPDDSETETPPLESPQENKAPNPVASSISSSCLWDNGQRLTLENPTWKKGSFTYQTESFQVLTPVTLTPSRIVFPQPSDLQVTPATHQLTIEGLTYTGNFSWGKETTPQWKFNGLPKSVSLNLRKKIEISHQGSQSKPLPKTKTPDQLILTDGTAIPCTIGKVSETHIHLTSPLVSATTIPLEELRACFFSPDQDDWQDVLTQETIQRVLTVPRFLRDANFSHILIAKSGDLLRGTLIEMNAQTVTFESRFENHNIDRSKIAAIIGFDTSDQTPAEKKPSKGAPIIRVKIGENFAVSGKATHLPNEGQLQIISPLVGTMKFDEASVQSININKPFSKTESFHEFTSWQLRTPIEPRWIDEEGNSYKPDEELLNQAAPPFELTLLDDTPFSLADHQGKVVVLVFWETGSRPSTISIQEYRKVIEKFPPSKVTFLGINQGQPLSKIREFAAQNQWSTIGLASDINRKIARLYQVSGIPQLVVIDREGAIRMLKVGYSTNAPQELRAKIQQLLLQ